MLEYAKRGFRDRHFKLSTKWLKQELPPNVAYCVMDWANTITLGGLDSAPCAFQSTCQNEVCVVKISLPKITVGGEEIQPFRTLAFSCIVESSGDGKDNNVTATHVHLAHIVKVLKEEYSVTKLYLQTDQCIVQYMNTSHAHAIANSKDQFGLEINQIFGEVSDLIRELTLHRELL